MPQSSLRLEPPGRCNAWAARLICLFFIANATVSCGSVTEGAATATLDRLDPLMTAHARALAGEDVAAMRATGRAVIATYDAGRGR